MLYYCSIADNHTGEFVGGVFLNRETKDAAGHAALELLGDRCVEVITMEVPAAPFPIPAIGKLLTRADLEALGPVRSVFTEG